MIEPFTLSPPTKAIQYYTLLAHATGLFRGESNLIANAANMSALTFDSLPDVNWCGFYFYDGKELVLGPFQGKAACVRITMGKGECGTAAQSRSTQVVRDVHAFPGHIACDTASRSEIVVPLIRDGELLGVWDVGSPNLSRFDDEDCAGMEALCKIFIDTLRS